LNAFAAGIKRKPPKLPKKKNSLAYMKGIGLKAIAN